MKDLIRPFFTLVFLLLLSFSVGVAAQDSVRYTLTEMVQRAKDRSPASLRAKTIRENRYWQYRLYRSNYNPQLRLNGTVPAYSQAFNNVTQPDGTIEFREVNQNLIDLGLGLQQVISPTGGVISINTSTNRFDNFLASDSEIQTRWSGVPVNISLQQPIFAFNPYKWDKKIQPLLYEESKREFVEEIEQVSMMVTELFFNYLIAQVNFEIATQNLKNTEQIFSIEKKRYEIGATFEDQLLQVELQTLEARQDLARAQLDLESSALAVNSFIGLNQGASIELLPPTNISEFDVDVEKAITYAFENRSEALGFDRQRLQAESDLAEAKGNRLQMNLNASYGYNNAAFTWADIYQNPNTQALVNLGISVPILDWGRNKARVSVALANQQYVEYTVEQETINFEQEIFTKVKNFLMIRERIKVTQKSDEVAAKRYEIALRRYQTGNVTITDLNIAQGQKDENKRAFYNSLKDYWMAYYELRALTLYDFENDELLYIPDLEDLK
ncbi:TolC family protein [Algoriphagus pacificus]|uniref:TolC family protein n=1 Tax=Algoriphagus pacificus TaxID=2811234 RepID=A0ABS3CMF0_9BACT|nr:TolC family protein [Algoriphagus pacificus]MBN7817905.1 TolC family protein [Algoriphagus pacificus]